MPNLIKILGKKCRGHSKCSTCEESDALLHEGEDVSHKGEVAQPGDTCASPTGGPWEELRQLVERVLRIPLTAIAEGRAKPQLVDLLVEEVVGKSFPKLVLKAGVEGGRLAVQEYLTEMMSLLWVELRDQQANSVVQAFHRSVFKHLHLALEQCSTVEEIFVLLHNVVQEYPSNIQLESVLTEGRLVDPQLQEKWIHRAEMKLLKALKESTSEALRRILRIEKEKQQFSNLENEEEFISLQIDVLQFLNRHIDAAKQVNQNLLQKVQHACALEMAVFVESYVQNETKQLRQPDKRQLYTRKHLFRIFNTCWSLRLHNESLLMDNRTISLLEQLQEQALRQLINNLVQDVKHSMEEYFSEVRGTFHNVEEKVKEHLHSLPKLHEDAHMAMANSAYQSIINLYLKTMLRSNFTSLAERWSNVGRWVADDAERLHGTFLSLNPNMTQTSQLLVVGELLQLKSTEELEQTCRTLVCEGPDMRTLLQEILQWKELPRKQIRRMLKTTQGLSSEKPQPICSCFTCCCGC